MEELDSGETNNFLHVDRLPNGWVVTPINRVCQIEMGQSPPSSTYNREEIGLPFFQGKAEFGDFYPTVEKYCSEPKKVAPESSVLISIRAPVGPTNIAREKSCIGRGLAAITPLGEIPSRFILYFFRAIEPALSGQGTGSTFKAISGQYLKSIPLYLPPSNEQRRIVAKIEELFSELDKGVESLKTARAQLKTYRQSLLKSAFEGRLTEQWRRNNTDKLETADQLLQRIREEREARYQQQLEEWKAAVAEWGADGKRYKKPRKPSVLKRYEAQSTHHLPLLPDSWQWVTLSELIENAKNGLYKPSSQYGTGCQIVRIDDFYDGILREEGEFKKVRASVEEANDYSLDKGDLLLNRVNSIEYLGKVGLVQDKHAGMLFESNMMRLSLLPNLIDPKLYSTYLSTTLGRSELTRNAKHAVNQASVNQTDVLSSHVPLMSKAESSVLLQYLDSRISRIKYMEQEIEEAIGRSSILRQSILKRAFEGKLVPQNPDDEPASALVERIRQEQVDAPKPKRRKRKAEAST